MHFPLMVVLTLRGKIFHFQELRRKKMGQYHYIVNLSKQEFIEPHSLGVGLKAYDQLLNLPSTPSALFILLMASNGRGGGDLQLEPESREKVIGRWVGDRIAVIGDYAQDDDIPGEWEHPISSIYSLCDEGVYRDISALVRPILAQEFDVEYYQEEWFAKLPDGEIERHESWYIRIISAVEDLGAV
jgi:hypothetical protein